MAKIAFIDVTATVSYGGIQTAIWELARTLCDMGHQVSVFSGKGRVSPDLGGHPVSVHTFSFTPRSQIPNLGTRFRKIAERFSFARNAKRAVIRGDFDWVILTKPSDFFWPWLMLRSSKTRFALMSGGTEFYTGDRFLARKIDAWLACSHFNAWQIQRRYGHFPAVMYNGVDVHQFRPRPPDSVVRAQFGAGLDEVLLVFAGRLVGWKGIAIALRALADLTLKGAPVRLVIIGDGPQLSELKRMADQLAIAQKVTFHDAVPHADLPVLYAAADIGIFPSIADEAFGITIAEAMSCGKPVIASYIGGIPEVVGNEGSCGLLVSPGDVKALAESIRILVDNAELRRSMGNAARSRIMHLYTWELAAKRLLAGIGITP